MKKTTPTGKPKGYWAKQKHDNFLRLSNDRLINVLQEIDKLEKVSDRTNYRYDEVEVNRLFKTIQAKLNFAKMSFKLKKERDFTSLDF